MSDTDQLKQQLLQLLQSPGYTPQDASGLARALCIDSHDRPILRELLRHLLNDGTLIRLKQQRYTLKSICDTPLRGRLKTGAKGKLYFCADNAGQVILKQLLGDTESALISLPVAPRQSMDALPGDIVLASIKKNIPPHQRRHRRIRPSVDELRPEARVLAIVERKLNRWVGTYHVGGLYGYMQGDGKTSPEKAFLSVPPPEGLSDGMCVTMVPERYPLGKMDATGHIAQVLGWPDEAGVDITRIMHQYALRDDFSPEVMAEVQQLPRVIPESEYAKRDDWRNRCVITIDPSDARDFDDAISVRRRGTGWELAVHITDVSYYVRPGSAIDCEAQERGNSTYLPDRVLPMLPPVLCDDLCSLREGVDRLTCLCLLRIDANGKTEKASFRKAIIRSDKRMSYEEVLPILEHTATSGNTEIDDMLREAHTLAQQLRRTRMRQGALELDIPELYVVMNDNGVPTDIRQRCNDISHQLIEECMLAANEAVARALNTHRIPAIHRVHEAPNPAKLTTLSYELKSYGIPVGLLNTREELCRITHLISGRQDESALKALILKSMMRARYAPESLGHFGLNKENYCHFTSPIRRYADLVVHRCLSGLIQGQKKYPMPSKGVLEALTEHLSETERNSATAENEAQQAKILDFLQAQTVNTSPRIFKAHISDAWMQGITVELPDLHLQGFISAETLDTHPLHWYYESHVQRWSNTQGHFLLPGTWIQVIPVHVDKEQRFIHFRLG